MYTVREANRALPYVRAIVEEICERYAAIERATQRLCGIPREDREARERVRVEVDAEAARLHACRAELRQIGAELKDYEMGLVDFPAVLDGRSILLCWRRGEESVAHWHDLESGFAGRRPVPAGASDWPAEPAAVDKR
jgi:hypothetical protein